MFFLPASTYLMGAATLLLYGLVDAWRVAIRCKRDADNDKESHTIRNAKMLYVFGKTMAVAFFNCFFWPILFVLLCPEICKEVLQKGKSILWGILRFFRRGGGDPLTTS